LKSEKTSEKAKKTEFCVLGRAKNEQSEFFSGLLNRSGYRSAGANNSRDAGLKLKNQKFDCILLDMRLGEERGEELILAIRQRPDYLNLNTPILVVSGNLDFDVMKTIKPHIQGALVKPFIPSDLLAPLKKILPPEAD
jgi:DNA-binding response OmpR family regulator